VGILIWEACLGKLDWGSLLKEGCLGKLDWRSLCLEACIGKLAIARQSCYGNLSTNRQESRRSQDCSSHGDRL